MNKVGFLFPGQGSQFIGMGIELYNSFEQAKSMLKEASDRLNIDFYSLLFKENESLSKTEYAQPAILLISSMAYQIFKEATHINGVFGIGHSLGELTALVSSGAISYIDGIEIVHKRGLLMKKACRNKNYSMMVVIGTNDEVLRKSIKEQNSIHPSKKMYIANYNCNLQTVIAGDRDVLINFDKIIKKKGARRTIILDMSVISHCEILESIVGEFRELLQKYIKNSFTFPIVSNVNTEKYKTKKEAINLLSKQLVSPVKYKQSVLKYEKDVEVFIEFGGSVLGGLNRKITKKRTYSITDLTSMQKAIDYNHHKGFLYE